MPIKVVYTHEEVKAIENYFNAKLKREQAEKERAQQLVRELIDIIRKKNALLSLGTAVMEYATEQIKELEKVKNG